MASSPLKLLCAICSEPVESLATCFRASGNFLPVGDPLTRYCNAPLHWSCYAEWPERPRFARCHVDAWVQANRLNPFWWSVYRDEQVYVSVNPAPPIEEASVRLYAVGSDIRVPLPKWGQWLEAVDSVTPGMTPFERYMLAPVLPGLRKRFPDDHAVVDAIDPAEKRSRRSR